MPSDFSQQTQFYERRRGDAAGAHDQLIDTGTDRWVQRELHAFVRNAGAAHVFGTRESTGRLARRV
jgi:hypothetical protein